MTLARRRRPRLGWQPGAAGPGSVRPRRRAGGAGPAGNRSHAVRRGHGPAVSQAQPVPCRVAGRRPRWRARGGTLPLAGGDPTVHPRWSPPVHRPRDPTTCRWPTRMAHRPATHQPQAPHPAYRGPPGHGHRGRLDAGPRARSLTAEQSCWFTRGRALRFTGRGAHDLPMPPPRPTARPLLRAAGAPPRRDRGPPTGTAHRGPAHGRRVSGPDGGGPADPYGGPTDPYGRSAHRYGPQPDGPYRLQPDDPYGPQPSYPLRPAGRRPVPRRGPGRARRLSLCTCTARRAGVPARHPGPGPPGRAAGGVPVRTGSPVRPAAGPLRVPAGVRGSPRPRYGEPYAPGNVLAAPARPYAPAQPYAPYAPAQPYAPYALASRTRRMRRPSRTRRTRRP